MKSPKKPEEKNKTGSRDSSGANMIHIQIKPRNFWQAVIGLAVPYLLALAVTISRTDWSFAHKAVNCPATNSPTPFNGSFVPLNPGPWGDLEYVRMNIEIPEEFLSVRSDEKLDRRWFFGGASPGQLAQFLSGAELNEGQRKELLDQSRWQVQTNGIYVTPSRETVFSLSPLARQKIYDGLSQFRENVAHQEAFTFVAAEFDGFCKDCGVKPEILALVKKLSYPHGKVLRFADLAWVLDTLPSYEEKFRLEKAVSRRPTLFLKLRITPETDVENVIRYWGRAGQTKDLRPLLDSLVKVPGGLRLNASFLLPDLAGGRLYTYPFPSLNQPENCHWTSFNFFKNQPELNYSDANVVKQKLDSDYFPVFSDPRYGDLVFLVKPNGDIIHSAVFLADDIVYTKNGGHFTAPWMLAKISDLVDIYSPYVSPDEKLIVAYYRNKYY